jgi:hypothetical protein
MRIVLQLILCVVPLLLPLVASAAPEQIDEAIPTLAFADFYKRPIGPRGLEPSARLLAAADSRVQLSGFVARGAEPHQPGLAILAPVPVVLGDEDEGLADDLPAAVAYLHWTGPNVAAAIAACGGAMRVAGRLELGRQPEPDGRSSFVRLVADRVQCAR